MNFLCKPVDLEFEYRHCRHAGGEEEIAGEKFLFEGRFQYQFDDCFYCGCSFFGIVIATKRVGKLHHTPRLPHLADKIGISVEKLRVEASDCNRCHTHA